MDELRVRIASEIGQMSWRSPRASVKEALEIADRILSIPEIAEALVLQALYLSNRSAPQGGLIRGDRKPLNLGPSISTNKRTPV